MMERLLLIGALLVALAGCAGPAVAGKREVYRYETGRISFKAFRDSDGKFHGHVLSYWPSGQLAERSQWNHGVPVMGKFYYETGVLKSEIKNGTGWRHCPEHSEYYHDGKYVRGAH